VTVLARVPYALTILWHDRKRYAPAAMAVTFSTVLIGLQGGLLLGQVVYSSFAIDHTSADLWVVPPDANSPMLAEPIPESWLLRVAAQPEVSRAEIYYLGQGFWHKPGQGAREACVVIGSRLDDDSLGAIRQMSAVVRARLTEPGTVAVISEDLATFGIADGNEVRAEINGQRVRVVGTITGFRGALYPHLFCSLETCRQLFPTFTRPLTSFVLARCRDPHDVHVVAERLRADYPEMAAFTTDEFSARTRNYWLFRTRLGTVLVCTVVLALLVGGVVTSETLLAAVRASLREYSLLDAMGLPRRRLVGLVLAQSWWIGLAGVLFALPLIFLLAQVAEWTNTHVLLPPALLLGTPVLNLVLAVLSGVAALRSLREAEPGVLLR
jgi:putative ABC transport system permease protein